MGRQTSPNIHSIMGGVATILLAISHFGCSASSDGPLESPEWFVRGVPSPGSADLSELTSKIIPGLIGRDTLYYLGAMKGVWRVDTVGFFGGHQVVDIYYDLRIPNWEHPTESLTCAAVKAIAIRTTTDMYRMAYLSFTEAGEIQYKPSSIIIVDNTDILATSSQMNGTGHFMDESYWTWDEMNQRPVDINQELAISRGSAKVCPPDHGVWKGGNFDIHHLKFDSYTWRDHDGNCCPSGGRLQVELGLSGGKAFVKSASFDYGDLEERALWVTKRSADSTYLKLGKRIWNGEATTESEAREWKTFLWRDHVYECESQAQTVETLVNYKARSVIQPEHNLARDTYPFQYAVDTIGLFHGFPFVEIPYWFHCPKCRDTVGKIVAVETSPSQFRPLYISISTPLSSGIGRNAVLIFGDDTVIAAKGCENYIGTYADNYWVWPKESPAPVPLFQEWVLTETLTRIVPKYLPKGLTARIHKGKWDFEKLSYETYTWKKEDPDNAPSGGKLFIQFGLKNHRLQPLDITFDSTAVAPPTN